MDKVSFTCRNSKAFVLVLIIFGIMISSARAQVDNVLNRKFLLGQQLEKQGYFEGALHIYEELYTVMPGNNTYYFKIRRMLEKLKRYDEWIAYLDAGLEANRNNTTLIGERARAHFLMGREDEAKMDWQRIIELNPASESHYRLVAQLQQGLRLYDNAIQTLMLGRERLNNPKAFASDLANIYQYRQDYRNAAREYIAMVTVDPKLFPIVEQRINSFPSDSEVVAVVTDELENIVADSSHNVNFRKLLSGFYIKNREYQNAFDSYIILDTMAQAGGIQILSFADQIFTIEEFNFSEKAYTHFQGAFPGNENTGRARFGLAKSLEQNVINEYRSSGAVDSLYLSGSGSKIRKALDEYHAIADIYAGTQLAVDAYYRIGEIKYHIFFDTDGAIEAYESVRSLSPGARLALQAALNIGDCYLSKGDREKAAEYYKLLETAKKKFEPLKLRAQYKLLLNEYYAGNFEKVRKSFEELFSKTPRNSDLSNDILSLILFLDNNLGDESAPLMRYVTSELLIRQRKLSEAERLLQENLTGMDMHPVSDDTRLKIAEIQKEMRHYNESIATLRDLVEHFPESPLVERASFEIAKIFEDRLRDTVQALHEYERFLHRYTNSIFIDEVRERIRKLRDKI